MRRAESRITLAKRGITTNINRANETKSSIGRQVQRGIKKESSIVAGMMKTGSGYVEAATNSNTELEAATDYLISILEEIIVQNEDRKDPVEIIIKAAEAETHKYAKNDANIIPK